MSIIFLFHFLAHTWGGGRGKKCQIFIALNDSPHPAENFSFCIYPISSKICRSVYMTLGHSRCSLHVLGCSLRGPGLFQNMAFLRKWQKVVFNIKKNPRGRSQTLSNANWIATGLVEWSWKFETNPNILRWDFLRRRLLISEKWENRKNHFSPKSGEVPMRVEIEQLFWKPVRYGYNLEWYELQRSIHLFHLGPTLTDFFFIFIGGQDRKSYFYLQNLL